MSRRLPRAAATAGAAAIALLLVAPTTALAEAHDSPAHGASAQTSTAHDPAGNNGTVKIDAPAPADSGHANRPHPGCAFQLRMFGFDDDQFGTITFTGQAPTRTGTLLTQAHVLLSDDPAGGGQDVDAVYSYTAQQLGLTGTPTAKQGWHVKVAVAAEDAPGGAKQKVFWLDCPAPSGTTTGAGTAGPAGTTVLSTRSVSGTPTAAPARTSLSSSTAGAGSAAVADRSAITGGGVASPALAATHGAGRTRGFAAALPFTGFALPTALALGVGAVAAGGLAIRAGRRRTAQG